MTISHIDDKNFDNLKKSGEILSNAMREVVNFLKSGISTMALDEVAERSIRKQGALPSFKNYYVSGSGRFPASLCVSINDELVHGVPKEKRYVKEGDLVSLDLGASYKGMFTDMAVTLGVGKLSKNDANLVRVAKTALEKAINYIKPNTKTGDLGNFIENYIKSQGFVAIHDLVGHGIGEEPHMDPQIPNFGNKGSGQQIKNSMAIAIEPMVGITSNKIKLDRDRWTIKMLNKKNCAHFEHTIAIIDNQIIQITNY